jgi:hypothetical protein
VGRNLLVFRDDFVPSLLLEAIHPRLARAEVVRRVLLSSYKRPERQLTLPEIRKSLEQQKIA